MFYKNSQKCTLHNSIMYNYAALKNTHKYKDLLAQKAKEILVWYMCCLFFSQHFPSPHSAQFNLPITNPMAPILLLHSNSLADFIADVYHRSERKKLWMQKACKIMQWQRLAHTPNTLLSSSIVTRKLLWHFYRITKARGNILNSSPPAVQCDKQLQALLSFNTIQLNKYCITQGTLLHLEKHKDRKSTPQDKHGPETEDEKSLTEARPRGRRLTKLIPSAPALKSM